MRLDPSTSLGLSEDSIHSFSIGDLVFGRGEFLCTLATKKEPIFFCAHLF